MLLHRFLICLCLLGTGTAQADTRVKHITPSLPKGATVLSQKKVDLDGSSPPEILVTYRYTTDGEEREVLGLYKSGCGLIWQSDEALGMIFAPSFGLRDITGEGNKDLLVYQPVHAGQELLVYAYQLTGCSLKELLRDYTYPPVPPTIRRDSEGMTVTFRFQGRDGCTGGGEEDEGFIHTYRYNGSEFLLVEDRPFRQLYPLFSASLSGGKEAASAAAQLLDQAKIYDHLAADLTGDGVPELIFLYNLGGRGALLVVARREERFYRLFEAALGEGPLSLDGAVRAINATDLTGDGVPELIFDSDADLGCQLDTWVVGFEKAAPELLLKVRRPLREQASLRSKEVAYQEVPHGAEVVWRWSGRAFVNQAGELFKAVRLFTP